MALDKEDSFWIGNVIGVVALLAVVIIVAPQKERERREYLAKQKAQATQAETAKSQQPTTVSIVTAADDIKAGAKIEESDVASKDCQSQSMKPQMLTDAAKVIGKFAKHAIKAGNPILATDITGNEDSKAEDN